MKLFILVLVLTLSACSSTQVSKPTEPLADTINVELETKESAEKAPEVPESQKVYYFQHRLLPELTYDSVSGDLLFADLMQGDLAKLQSIAAEIISADYATGMASKYYPEHDAALITFPTPKSLTNCFFVLIKKGDKGYHFYTYEKTLSFSEDDPVKGVVGLWSEDGTHGNLGGRTYSTANEFVSDLMKE